MHPRLSNTLETILKNYGAHCMLKYTFQRSGEYTKNAIKQLWKKWPDATIPYQISSSFSSYERSVIAKAMKTYHQKTCIKYTFYSDIKIRVLQFTLMVSESHYYDFQINLYTSTVAYIWLSLC